MNYSPLWISIRASAAATAITFVLGLAAARALCGWKGRWRGLVDGILILPLVLPPTVVGFFLLVLLGRRSVIGHALEQLGLAVAFSWPATVIAATVVAFPLMYRTALGAFEQVNPDLAAVARTLGAGEWRVFRRVQLPLAWPGVMAGTVLAFARALGEFGATLMLAGNIPGRTQTMPVAIFFAAEGGEMRLALMWVAWTVALSLGTIVAMHYWSGSRPRLTVQRATAAEPWIPPASSPQAAARGAELRVEIRKRLGNFQLGVDFRSAGGMLGILGASGAGKSMTLRSIAGLERPDDGRIVVNGRTLFDRAAGISLSPASRRVGMVFQDYALFPHLTVRQNIAFGLRGRTVEEWARLAQVEPLLARYPAELSGGQRQRVALARALATEPDVLLLDEPFGALDPHLRRQMEGQLRAILSAWAGAAVMVTHDSSEAYRLCEELVILSEGRVEAAGAREKLFQNPGTVAAARVTGCKNIGRIGNVEGASLRVEEWNCTLHTGVAFPSDTAYVGIRAHHIRLALEGGDNTFACWLVDSVESPFEATLYLRLSPRGPAQLEMDVPIDRWRELAPRAQPWRIQLPPDRLLLLRE